MIHFAQRWFSLQNKNLINVPTNNEFELAENAKKYVHHHNPRLNVNLRLHQVLAINQLATLFSDRAVFEGVILRFKFPKRIGLKG